MAAVLGRAGGGRGGGDGLFSDVSRRRRRTGKALISAFVYRHLHRSGLEIWIGNISIIQSWHEIFDAVFLLIDGLNQLLPEVDPIL
jgi:hypothetical protein